MRGVRATLSSVALILCAALLSEAAAQESGTVTGEVTDAATGAPITSAQIVVVGTNIGALTDQRGRFLIPGVPAGAQEIRAVIIGYAQETQTVTVAAGGTATANFQLETSAVALGALVVNVVTGREQRARELGASVSTIDLENLNPAPITSLADALGGRSEGIIMQDVNGTTGTAQRIRIRGANSLSLSNEPLIYIDGIQANSGFGGTFGVGGQESGRLGDLNPSEIANIEIIKGPAASALYGTAAANGVILITTKRGRPGDTQWNAWVETGTLEDITDYPANYGSIDVINPGSPKFTDSGLLNRYLDAPGSDAHNPTGYGFFCSNARAGLDPSDANYCERDEFTRFNTLTDPRTRMFETGTRRRIGFSVRGGTQTVRYFVSGQREDEDGVVSLNQQEKVNFRANLDARLSQTADLSVSFGYAQNNLQLNNNDNSIFSPILNGLVGRPYFVAPDPDNPVKDPVNDSNYGFGYNLEELTELPTLGGVDRYITSTNLRWRPLSWLSVNATGGLDLVTNHAYETLRQGGLPAFYDPGWRNSRRLTNYNYTGQLSGIGTFELAPDLISTTTVGTSYTRENEENTECYGEAVTPGTRSCGSVASNFFLDEDFFEVRTIGTYVQQEFGWRDRLFLAAGVRGDDNSAFGTDFDFALYPSASLSWVIAEEEWFPELSFLNTLRLRTAWGVSGLRPDFRDATTLYDPTTVAADGGDVPGVSLFVTGNPELKPERSREYEFGFDTGLFDDRLSLGFTYFNKESKDALIERRLPGSLGVTESRFENLGSLRNTGTELTANLLVYESDDVAVNVGFTNTTLENELLELGENVEDINFNRGLQRHTPGFTAGGFWQQEVLYEDVNRDGLLTICNVADDQDTCIDEVTLGDDKFIGPALPEWQRTLFAEIRLFDFLNIATLFEGRGGHYTGNDSEAFRCGFDESRGCPAIGDPNASLEQQAAYLADRYLGSTFLYVEKADFYKWRELSLTFSVPNAWAQRFQTLEGLRLTLAGRNLATWTDYSGLDPETVEGGGDANFSQSEFNTQPPVRYLMLRLDYSF